MFNLLFKGKSRLVLQLTFMFRKVNLFILQITQWMASWNIPASEIMGLATDGAAVMTWLRSVVGVRMKTDNFGLVHIHCVAHKLALVVSQAAVSVKAIKLYESTVESIYFHFSNSAVKLDATVFVKCMLFKTTTIFLHGRDLILYGGFPCIRLFMLSIHLGLV